MQIQELMALIEAHVPALGAELQRAAAWVARNPRDAGLLSMRQQAAQAGVSPNSMARLAQALGYEGYGPFRQVFQDALGHGAPAYKERVRRLQGEAASQFDDALLRTHLDNARSPTVANAPKDIARAVQRMRAARRLYFLGTRSCFAISYHFAYAYSMIAGNGVLVHGLGGTYPDQLDAAGPEDLLVCVTQNPYGRQTLEAARDCRQAGVPVLALTDSRWRRSRPTPRRRCCSMPARRPISIRWWDRWRWSSGCWLLAAAGGEAAQQRIDAFERRLDASSAYFGGPSPGRAGAPGKHDRIPRRRPRLRPAHPHHVPRLIVSRQQIPTLAPAPSLSRRRFSLCMALAAAGLAGPAASRAQDAAKRPPIRLVVPFAAGATDAAGPPAGRGTARGPGPARAGREQGRGGRQHRRRRSGARAGDGATLMMATPGPLAVNQYLYPAGLQRRKGFLRDQQRGLRGQRADGQRPERHPRLA